MTELQCGLGKRENIPRQVAVQWGAVEATASGLKDLGVREPTKDQLRALSGI